MLFNPMRPVFVKFPQGVNFGGTKYKKSQEVPWVYLGIDEERIRILVQNDFLYHNYELEEQNKVGDGLQQMSFDQLKTLYGLLNSEVKNRCSTKEEFNKNKIKNSLMENRLRANFRSWLYQNKEWAKDLFEDKKKFVLSKNAEPELVEG
jgi:hypothetical protein